MKIGYGRVSRLDQHAEAQHTALVEAGCEKVFIDQGQSGKKASRPQLDACLSHLREGDTLYVTKLDRLGRSTRHLLQVVEELQAKKVGFKALDQDFDTTTNMGKLVVTILAAVAEFEHGMMLERTHDGLAYAREHGRVGGGQRKLKAHQVIKAQHMFDLHDEAGKKVYSVDEIAGALGVSRPTIYRHLDVKAAKLAAG